MSARQSEHRITAARSPSLLPTVKGCERGRLVAEWQSWMSRRVSEGSIPSAFTKSK